VHGNHSGPIRYENVNVPQKDRLGDENQGKDIIYHGVSPVYLIGLGAVWHGVARAALEEVVKYVARTTHQDFNRSLSDYQVLRQQIGEAKILVSSLGPWQADLARQLNELEAAGRPQGEILLPLTEFKVHAAEVANKVARLALDISGGYGYKRGLLERRRQRGAEAAHADVGAMLEMFPTGLHRTPSVPHLRRSSAILPQPAGARNTRRNSGGTQGGTQEPPRGKAPLRPGAERVSRSAPAAPRTSPNCSRH